MNEILEFFRGLFSYQEWPPRWNCGNWSDFHGWLYIISELMVWTAYFLIPLIILNYFQKKRTSIRFRRVYILFATFILLCGATHFIDALMFWVPMYRFNALVRLATGVVSLFTVYHLFRVLPDLFKQRTNLELEKEIARRKEAEQKLEKANRELEAFAYVASHDLQEPLRKIQTFTSLLFDANRDAFDERSKGYAQRIDHSVQRMRGLIGDVLSLSTIPESITLEPVNLQEVVQQAVDELDLKIAERNAEVTIDELPAVIGNKSYLVQLFTNLLSNGLKFNDKGTPRLAVRGWRQGEVTYVEVSDNGIGFSTENYQKIFEAFQRLHDRSEYEGTGIGLAICKKIIDVHKGQITVESEPGNGTTFRIELPTA